MAPIVGTRSAPRRRSNAHRFRRATSRPGGSDAAVARAWRPLDAAGDGAGCCPPASARRSTSRAARGIVQKTGKDRSRGLQLRELFFVGLVRGNIEVVDRCDRLPGRIEHGDAAARAHHARAGMAGQPHVVARVRRLELPRSKFRQKLEPSGTCARKSGRGRRRLSASVTLTMMSTARRWTAV